MKQVEEYLFIVFYRSSTISSGFETSICSTVFTAVVAGCISTNNDQSRIIQQIVTKFQPEDEEVVVVVVSETAISENFSRNCLKY
jgi:hypothetical protein